MEKLKTFRHIHKGRLHKIVNTETASLSPDFLVRLEGDKISRPGDEITLSYLIIQGEQRDYSPVLCGKLSEEYVGKEVTHLESGTRTPFGDFIVNQFYVEGKLVLDYLTIVKAKSS